MVTLHNVISSDGFITCKDGSEDFIPDNLWPEFLASVSDYDVFVIGRKTYEAVQHYDEALLVPFEELPIKKVVVTRDGNFKPKAGYIVAHSIEEAIAQGTNVLVSSGPGLNTGLLTKNLVDKIILDKVSVAIGEGIEPFPKDIYEKLPSKIEIHEKS